MKIRLSRLAVVAALLAALTPIFGPPDPAAAQSGPPRGPDPIEGEILVKFKEDAAGQAAAQALQAQGGLTAHVIPGIDVHVVKVAPGRERGHVAALARDPGVRFAERNGRWQAAGHGTNDPRVGQQWAYNNTGQTGGTADADTDAFQAWHVTLGSSAVPIAILDSGIDLDHEDLRTKVKRSVNFSSSGNNDDRYGHGTHVAGIAAAATDNGAGVAGICPNCVLYNVKVLSDDGGGSWSSIANGISWAARNGVKVISMSFGGYARSQTVELAVNNAWRQGIILVAAALNDGQNWGAYPAAYPNVIAVAATDHRDARWEFSNWGPWVDVAAPGVSILSTAPNHSSRFWGAAVGYGLASGTSMSTPMVAGVAGLVWSTQLCGGPASKNNACVRTRLESRADQIAGTGSFWARGRINACRAVKSDTNSSTVC